MQLYIAVSNSKFSTKSCRSKYTRYKAVRYENLKINHEYGIRFMRKVLL